MQSVEVEAKTVEEAVALACKQLNTTKDNIQVEILDQGPGVLMSFFSSKKAKIRAELIDGDVIVEQAPNGGGIDHLQSILVNVVQKIQPEASVSMSRQEGEILFNINADGSGIFIGKHGQTLEAFQYLMNKIRLSKYREIPHIRVDSESYRSRHIESMVALAQTLSEKAKKRGGPVTTNPLSPGDRRIIHMTLKKDDELTTWSKGAGNLKKVIIAPRQSAEA